MWTFNGSIKVSANAINAWLDAKHCCVILDSFFSKVLKVCESSGHFWKRDNAASQKLVHKRAPWRAHTH